MSNNLNETKDCIVIVQVLPAGSIPAKLPLQEVLHMANTVEKWVLFTERDQERAKKKRHKGTCEETEQAYRFFIS